MKGYSFHRTSWTFQLSSVDSLQCMDPIQMEVTFHHLHVTQGWGSGGLDQESAQQEIRTHTNKLHISLMPPRQRHTTHTS